MLFFCNTEKLLVIVYDDQTTLLFLPVTYILKMLSVTLSLRVFSTG